MLLNFGTPICEENENIFPSWLWNTVVYASKFRSINTIYSFPAIPFHSTTTTVKLLSKKKKMSTKQQLPSAPRQIFVRYSCCSFVQSHLGLSSPFGSEPLLFPGVSRQARHKISPTAKPVSHPYPKTHTSIHTLVWYHKILFTRIQQSV